MANIKLTAANDQLAQGTTGDDIVTLDATFDPTAENAHDGNGGSDTFVLGKNTLANFGGADQISYVGGSVKEWTLDTNGATTSGDTTLENGFTKVQFADGNVLEAGVASVHNAVVTDGIYDTSVSASELTYRWDGSNLTSDDPLANADTIVSVGGQVIADVGTIFNTPDGQVSIVDSGSATSVQFTASAAALRAAGNVGGTASFSFDIVIRNDEGVERTVPVTFQEEIPFTDGNDTWVAAATGSTIDETGSEDDGNDTFTGGAGVDNITAGDGNDTLTGGESNDVLVGGAGDDNILGENGDDFIDGGTGENFLRGGNGDDIIVAQGGTGDSNNLGGGAGSDVILGGDGADTIFGGNGDDSVGGDKDYPAVADDTWGLNGGEGNDMINGGAGDDLLFGGLGTETAPSSGVFQDVLADGGNDELRGGDGNDTMFGGTGNDTLRGGAGDDTYDGGAGDDALFVSLGNDTLTGGTGDDTFILRSDSGNTVITDFTANSDKLDISGLVAQGMTLQSILDNAYEVDPGTGNDFVVLQIDADTTVTLKASSDLSLGDLDAGDFLV